MLWNNVPITSWDGDVTLKSMSDRLYGNVLSSLDTLPSMINTASNEDKESFEKDLAFATDIKNYIEENNLHIDYK